MFFTLLLSITMTENLINLTEYTLPSKQPKIVHMYPNLFTKENLGFDIFDYNFLFNDPETLKLIREGQTPETASG
jgi:hypothetical protein